MSRAKLLEAAARVFAECGFRGATTRRIAEVAGVNEVTLFRQFGSKAQLLSEAMNCLHPGCDRHLPETPVDVERELTEWSEAHLESMRAMGPVIRRTLAELDEHPEMRTVVSEARAPYINQLVAFATKVRRPSTAKDRDDLRTACTMLSSSLFSDAIGREVLPAAYPEPRADAAKRYVRLFLRLLAVPAATSRPRRSPVVARSRAT